MTTYTIRSPSVQVSYKENIELIPGKVPIRLDQQIKRYVTYVLPENPPTQRQLLPPGKFLQ